MIIGIEIGVQLTYLIIHVIGDFYLQTQQQADRKENHYSEVVIHSLTYLILMLVPFLIYGPNFQLFIVGLTLGISHFLIDTIKFLVMKTKIYKASNNVQIAKLLIFMIDQLLHVIVILYVVKINSFWRISSNYYYDIMADDFMIFRWILVILLLMKPSNIIFKFTFGHYKPVDERLLLETETNEIVKERNAGAWIGNLERLISIICIFIGQYAAIGLILTAKSVARYNKISEEPKFAEYYLLGTLSSLLLTIVWYFLVFIAI